MKKSEMIIKMTEFYKAISLLDLTTEEKMKTLLDEQIRLGMIPPADLTVHSSLGAPCQWEYEGEYHE
jgi:hypothetical protein